MKITKRDTKRVLRVNNGDIVKEKYNVVYINCLLNDIENGMSAKNLQKKYKNYFVNSEGKEVKLETWQFLVLNKFFTEETEEEFKETYFNIDDIRNLLPHIEEEVDSIRNLLNYIEETGTDSTNIKFFFLYIINVEDKSKLTRVRT